jgi:hypothetical protein
MSNGMGFNMGNGMGYGNGSFGIILFMLLFLVGLVGVAIFFKNYIFAATMGNTNSTYSGRKVVIVTGICNVCGKELQQDWRVCPHCGKELKPQNI